MKIGLNTLRVEKKGLHGQLGCSCDCEVCSTSLEGGCCDAHHNIYKRINQLWIVCICPKPELAEWHKQSCLMGE